MIVQSSVMSETNKAGADGFENGLKHALTVIDYKLTDLIWGFL